MYSVEELEAKYDADNDTMPGLPDVTWCDYELLCLIKSLTKRMAKLEKQLAAPHPLDQALNEGDGVYRP
jgi:hypothetical protein